MPHPIWGSKTTQRFFNYHTPNKNEQMKTYNCKSCGNDFESKKGCKTREPKYCSSKCYGVTLKMEIKCKLCNQVIENKHSASLKNRIYCSRKCQSEARLNKPLNEEWKQALSVGRKSSIKCKGENLYNWKGGKETETIRMKSHFYKRKRGLQKEMPITFLHRMLMVQKNKCFFCECDLTDYKAIEHLTPISKGGDNDVFNLVYSCKSCNSKKRQNTLEEFAIKQNRIDWLNKWEHIFSIAL
jgi:5-methylcytosine-specific restriction endonuclease McrA